MSLWDVKFRDFGERLFRSLSPRTLPASTASMYNAYRAKYITCLKPGIRPFFHMMAVVMLVNYAIEFKHLRKHEAIRKYH